MLGRRRLPNPHRTRSNWSRWLLSRWNRRCNYSWLPTSSEKVCWPCIWRGLFYYTAELCSANVQYWLASHRWYDRTPLRKESVNRILKNTSKIKTNQSTPIKSIKSILLTKLLTMECHYWLGLTFFDRFKLLQHVTVDYCIFAHSQKLIYIVHFHVLSVYRSVIAQLLAHDVRILFRPVIRTYRWPITAVLPDPEDAVDLCRVNGHFDGGVCGRFVFVFSWILQRKTVPLVGQVWTVFSAIANLWMWDAATSSLTFELIRSTFWNSNYIIKIW